MRKNNEPRDLMTLGLRIRWIIQEEQIKQVEFAKALGISANYVYLLTSGKKTAISEPLARLIESTYGYSAEWILTGRSPGESGMPLSDLQSDTIQKVKRMDYTELRAVAAFIKSLQEMDRA